MPLEGYFKRLFALMRQQIEHDRLIELLHYDADYGVFTNKTRRSNVSPIGKVLGTANTSGHLVLMVDNVMYLAHRLAWFYCFKEWPEVLIDHIDRDPSNNRIDNLREATKSTNGFNSKLRIDNTIGLKGVYFDKRRNHFYSQIVINKTKIYLGRFDSAQEAHTAYINKAKELQGEFFNEDNVH